ncbi:MAG: MerR family transcriptional regulator [Microbacterium sp.]|nr:MerR family transcriptional regulator [Microbacterium sp.]MBN9223230.1 MerR family transcriptional regulator [Microbacterium sp.]
MTEPDRDPGRTRGVYSIAIAAELVGVGIQTLRLYESRGLVDPARSTGGTRRYSDADVDVLRRVVALLAEGVNLAGARRIIQLEDDNHALRATLRRTRAIEHS